MYTKWMYVTMAFLICLVPFSVPIKIKNHALRRIRNLLLAGFVISSLISLTPEKAVNGAPFNFFGDAKITYFSCTYQLYLTKAKFCLDTPESADCECSNENARATMAACFYFSSHNGKQDYINMCAKQHNVFISEEEYDNSLLNYQQNAKFISDVENFTDGSLVDFPVRLDLSKSHIFKDSYEQFLGNYDNSVIFGGYLVFYWVIIFTIFSVINWSKVFFPSIHKALVDPFSNWFRKTISSPATGGKKKTDEQRFLWIFDFLVPTRLETIIISIFLALTIYLTFKDIHYVEGDPVFRSKYRALYRYYAVRTSILGSSCMPLLILFGGRNNFLQGFTRWDYSTFITFHRWLSRIVVVLVVIHSTLYTLYDGSLSELSEKTYIKWGILGTASGILILVQGMLFLRRRYYELFLIIHIALAFCFVLGAYVHVLDLYCLWFYHYCFAIWIFDRLVRIFRLYNFGFPKSKVYLLADEALKVVIPKPENFEVIPGGHVFIHFLRPTCFWQSHPFTYTKSPNNDNEIIIFMKVKKGITQHIYNYLSTHPKKVAEIRVAIEGSYGEKSPAQAYDSAVFIAGGNGIPGIYAEALELATSRFNKTRVKLIWVIREYRSLFWFYEELLALEDVNIEVELYITKPTSYEGMQEFSLRFPSENEEIVPVSSITETTNLRDCTPLKAYSSVDECEINLITKIKQELSFVTFKEGRPLIDQIVKDTIKESTGSVAYITCGHPVMVDDLRAAVVNNINNPEHKRIDYFEQLQVWA